MCHFLLYIYNEQTTVCERTEAYCAGILVSLPHTIPGVSFCMRKPDRSLQFAPTYLKTVISRKYNAIKKIFFTNAAPWNIVQRSRKVFSQVVIY
jgi:hypothetical protein